MPAESQVTVLPLFSYLDTFRRMLIAVALCGIAITSTLGLGAFTLAIWRAL